MYKESTVMHEKKCYDFMTQMTYIMKLLLYKRKSYCIWIWVVQREALYHDVRGLSWNVIVDSVNSWTLGH